MSLTPCVLRPVSRISFKLVRSTIPFLEISIMPSSSVIQRMATTGPVRSLRLSVRAPEP